MRRAWLLATVLPLLAGSCASNTPDAGYGPPAVDGSADRDVGAAEASVDAGNPGELGQDQAATQDMAADAAGDVAPAGDVAGADGQATDTLTDVMTADAADASPPLCTPAGTCHPFMPDACANGQICSFQGGPSSPFMASCLTIVGARAEGEACGGAMVTCGAGLMCRFEGGTSSFCRRLCLKGSRGMCGAEGSCTGSFGDPCVLFCSARARPCDPLAQDCPAATDKCDSVSDGETGQTYAGCRLAGQRVEGEPCGNASLAETCVKGQICAKRSPTDAAAACRRICNPGGAPACVAGQSCTGRTAALQIPYCL